MAPSPKVLRRRYLSRPPVEPMRLRAGLSVEELVDVYRRAGAFNGGRLAEGCDLFGRMIDSGATIALTVTGATQPTLWQILDLDRGGHEYVLQISTDSPQWGGLSGATPSEAISWGKVQADLLKNHVVVYSDATVAAPLVFAYALSTRKRRRPRRLFRRLPELYEALHRAHLRRHETPRARPVGAESERETPGRESPFDVRHRVPRPVVVAVAPPRSGGRTKSKSRSSSRSRST